MNRIPLLVLLWAHGCAHAPPGQSARAESLRRQGRVAEAYAAYAAALCEEPGRLELGLRLVEAWQRLAAAGSPGARIEHCHVAPFVRLTIDGLAAAVSSDIDDAEALLAQAEEQAPLDLRAEVAFRRGLVALNGGRPAAARAHLERSSGLDPARADVRIALAQARLESGQVAEAAAALRGLMALEPAVDDIERARRLLYVAVHRAEAPLPAATQALLRDLLADLERGELKPDVLARITALAEEVNHPRVLSVAGLVALQRGLDYEARRLLGAAAELNPLDPEPWRVLGVSLYASKRAGEAVEPLAQALQRDPFDAQVAAMLAPAAVAADKLDLARDTYRTLTLLEPEQPEHYLGLARSERQLGHAALARRAAVAGCALDPRDVSLLVELASSEAQLALDAVTEREREEARTRAREAVERLLEVAPDHPAAAPILDGLARREAG